MTNERNVGMIGFSTWLSRLRPTEVEARIGHGLGLRYSDGMSSESDPSDLAGKGVFNVWTTARYSRVYGSTHTTGSCSARNWTRPGMRYTRGCADHQTYPGGKSD